MKSSQNRNATNPRIPPNRNLYILFSLVLRMSTSLFTHTHTHTAVRWHTHTNIRKEKKRKKKKRNEACDDWRRNKKRNRHEKKMVGFFSMRARFINIFMLNATGNDILLICNIQNTFYIRRHRMTSMSLKTEVQRRMQQQQQQHALARTTDDVSTTKKNEK